VGPEFVQGLEAFTSILKSYEINPRTLGVSDYPTNTPLDEVISIMDQCVGAIILGYPQIEVKEGVLKGGTIESCVVLATEWNHIEAGLAYAKRLPLLVIHHKGVRRGIFDRGAIGKYLYEVDLSNSTWFSEEQIIGAIVAWKNILTETISTEGQIEKPAEALSAQSVKQQARAQMEYQVLKTLWTKQVNRFPDYSGLWSFRINANTPVYLPYREAASKLIGEGLISETDQGQLYLTKDGFEYCKNHYKEFPLEQWWPEETIDKEKLRVALGNDGEE